MRFRAVSCAFLAAIAVVAVAGPTVAAAPGTTAATASPTDGTASNTTIAIALRPSGDARFSVATGFDLDDRNDVAGFRSVAGKFEAGATGASITPFRRAAAAASNATGRPMNVTNVTRNATIVGGNRSANGTGRLVLAFTWSNFARESGDALFVGDAFNTTRGTWLPQLTARQTLLVETPRRYAIVDSPPVSITDRTLRWDGPETFEPGEPHVTYERRSGPVPSSATNATTDANASDDPDSGPFVTVPPVVLGTGAVVVGAGALIVGMYTLTRRREGEGASTAAVGGDHEAPSTPDATEPASTAEATTDESADDELLSDEERVERLLERNDGRMKQATIVDETGWSNAKVSQLLSAMDDTGRIEKLRIGRENLISLPDDGETP